MRRHSAESECRVIKNKETSGMFRIKIDTREFGGEIRRVREAARNWEIALEIFGAYMIKETAENFRQQGRPEKWQDLRTTTKVARYLRGNRSRQRKRRTTGAAWERYSAGMKILQDSGRLAGSIGFSAHKNVVEIGTNLIYAATHNFGDKRRNIPERRFLQFQDADEERLATIIENWLTGE